MPSQRTILIIGSVIVAVLLLVLGVWYFVLRGEGQDIADVAAGRGFGNDLPFFGSPTGSTSANLSGDTTGTSTTTVSQPPPRLWRVSATAAAGFSITKAGDTSLARFIERPTGNVFETNLETGTSTRLTTTLVPQVYRAIWVDDERVVLQTLADDRTIETFASTIITSTTTNSEGSMITSGELQSIKLEDAIHDLLPYPDGSGDLVYLVRYEGTLLGIRSDFTGADRSRLWESPLMGWQLKIGSDTLYLVQHAAGGRTGGSYSLGSSGELTPRLTDVTGLSVVPHPSDSAQLLYSSASASQPPRLRVWSSTTQETTTLSVATLAEKCAWDPSAADIVYCGVPRAFPDVTYPDAWYRGEVHFSDYLYRIDVATGAAEPLYFPQEDAGYAVDVTNIRVSDTGDYLLFIDANTQTPWVFRINE